MAKPIPKINEQNEVIGETTIPEAKANGWMRRIARVFIFDTDGRLLLQKRGDVPAFPHLWDQSVGGHVDMGETDAEAAAREMEEELGITPELTEIVTGYRTDDPGDRVFSSVYTAVVASDVTLTPDPHEVEDTKWFTIAEFEQAVTDRPEEFVPTFVNIWFAHRDTLIP